MCIFSAGRNMKQKLCHGSSGPEDMDEPKDPKRQTAADGSGYNSASSLATRILRSPVAV